MTQHITFGALNPSTFSVRERDGQLTAKATGCDPAFGPYEGCYVPTKAGARVGFYDRSGTVPPKDSVEFHFTQAGTLVDSTSKRFPGLQDDAIKFFGMVADHKAMAKQIAAMGQDAWAAMMANRYGSPK